MHTTTTHSRLDSLLRRMKHRSVYDLVLPGLALAGLVIAGASITGA